jgi:hypothetical protein
MMVLEPMKQYLFLLVTISISSMHDICRSELEVYCSHVWSQCVPVSIEFSQTSLCVQMSNAILTKDIFHSEFPMEDVAKLGAWCTYACVLT